MGRGCLREILPTADRFTKMILESYTLRWTFPFLLCFYLLHGASGDCGPPPVIPNTDPVQETSGTPGQTVFYRCNRNTGYYEIPNKSTTITCQDDNTWTNFEEFCTRACGVPERITFAEPKQGALDQNIFLPNATVSYNCRAGYSRVPGSKNSITCLESYTWSTPEIFCQRRSCGNPGEVENGNLDATDFLFGSRVTYRCNDGYRMLSARNYRDCLADGTWSNSLPQCDAVICAAPEKPANGEYYPQKDEYTYLDSITFSCQKPLEVVGAATISCTADGTWSSSSPTCKAVNCQDPVVENSIRRSGFIGPYTLNSAITFECKKDFVLKGSDSIRCNIDSQWVPGIPKCEQVTCGDPGPILNGEISAPNFNFGSKASYTCKERFALNSTENIRTCQEDGTWSGSPLACAAICKDPPTVPFATHTGSHRIYFNGTVVHYKCNYGYENDPAKENKVTCTVHSWSAHDEFCTRVSCGKPEEIKNGHVSAPDHRYGSRAIYTCADGYVLNTTLNYRECQADGTWSSPIACIDKADELKGLSVGAIIGIVIAVLLAVLFFGILLFKCLRKKQKRGKLEPDTPNVQYSHCKGINT